MTSPNENDLRRVYAQFDAGLDSGRESLLDRLRGESKPMPQRRNWWAAAVSGLAAALAMGLILWMSLAPGGLVWAQVRQQLQKVRTASGRVTQEHRFAQGGVSGPTSSIWYFRGPDQMRFEDVPDKTTTRPAEPSPAPRFILFNATGHPGTFLEVTGRTAEVHEPVFYEKAPASHIPTGEELFTRLRDLDSTALKRIGEERLGDRRLVRFEVPSLVFDPTGPDGIMTIWVDPATSLPVQTRVMGKGSQGARYKVEMHDLRFDQPLDDGLFAWPRLSDYRVGQSLQVSVRSDLARLSITLTASDGTPLITTADFQWPQAREGYLLCQLKPPAGKRLEEFSVAHVGQSLTVQVGGAPARKVEILGAVDLFLTLTAPDGGGK